MKLYKFDFCNHEIQRSVLEAEEKPKTYFVKEKCWNTRLNKLDIGIVNYNAVYLLEDDIEKAKAAFRNEIRKNRKRKTKNYRCRRKN